MLGRLAALAVAVLMLVAALTVHLSHGFFMNWFGTQKGEGWEYHLLAMAMSAVIMIKGSGAWSIDARIASAFTPGGAAVASASRQLPRR